MHGKSSTFLAMKASLLADALCARDPGAPAALYDTHAESLFRYCWFILRNRDAAQLALRDALVAAEAHIGQLHAPGLLRPWLYALARSECLRRQQSSGARHDAVVARPDQPDADRRLIAWQAVMSLAAEEREALELTIRHGMDAESAALVMGLPTTEIRNLLAEGRVHLEHALAGEILARHGVHGCPERAGALQGWAGEMTVTLRERLMLHAISCQVCGRYLPRNVSATKVCSLLPVPVPPQAMRLRIMTSFSDPELVGYRMFVAARVTRFDQRGFPDGSPASAAAPRRALARLWSGPAAAAVAVAVLVAAVFTIQARRFQLARAGCGILGRHHDRGGALGDRAARRLRAGRQQPPEAGPGRAVPAGRGDQHLGQARPGRALPARDPRPRRETGARPVPAQCQPAATGQRPAPGLAHPARPGGRFDGGDHADRGGRPGRLVGLDVITRPHSEQHRRHHPAWPAGDRDRDGQPLPGRLGTGDRRLRAGR